MPELKIEYWPLSKLKGWPKNPKDHDLGAIHVSVEEFDFNDPIGINTRTGQIVEGHGRLDVLQQRKASGEKPPGNIIEREGEWIVPVLPLDMDDKTADRYSLAHNRTSELGGWNEEVLADVLSDLAADDLLDGTGWDADQVDELLKELGKGDVPPEDPGAQTDKAEELQKKWKVKTGDLWQLGEHWLICGDCTDEEVVARMMDGEKADLFVTDPPYGVGYVEKARDMHKLGYGHSRARLARLIENDARTETDADIGKLLSVVLTLWWTDYVKPGGVFYLCCPPGNPETTFRNVISGFCQIRQCIVWIKNNFVIGRQDYHWRHESILYGWINGAGHYFKEDRTQDTVWEESRDSIAKVHPTMKPVSVLRRMIDNSSRIEETVVDPFLGSGTTLIACEQLGRRCRGVEIEPKYCAVALERWSVATGKTPGVVSVK